MCGCRRYKYCELRMGMKGRHVLASCGAPPNGNTCRRADPLSSRGGDHPPLQVFRVWAILLGNIEERVGDGGVGWAGELCDPRNPF